MNRPRSFLYLNDNYYEPLKINEDWIFECIKKVGDVNYFCKFKISEFNIEEIELQIIRQNIEKTANLIILDFFRLGLNIYFHTNCSELSTLYKQNNNETKIIYCTTNKISQICYKNGFIVFFENNECKCVDLDSHDIDGISIREAPVDFCVI
jgi:hypothetical protein